MNVTPVRWDVIIVGAGPAGSTAAALLAERGVQVLVLEKDDFPRFHIGESLLPAAKSVLDQLGVEPNAQTYCHKRGAQFVDEAKDRVAAFDFAHALPGPPRHAWHVERSRFDTQLRDVALSRGAEIRHGVQVADFEVEDSGVTVKSSHGPERARYLIDATGQNRLVAGRRRAVEPYECFGRAAAFTHYRGVSKQAFAQLGEGNDIRIMMLEGGWAWIIPLPGECLSVGLVRRTGGAKADDVFDYVASSPFASRLCAGAEQTAARIVSNFSYRNTQPYGARYACAGDAACFIDPVFSSGVSLAMTGSVALVDRLVPALAAGSEGEADLMNPLATQLQRAYDTFAALVYRFYNTQTIDRLIFGAPEDAGELRSSVISVLAGDVFRQDSVFAQMLLKSRLGPQTRTNGLPGGPASAPKKRQETRL